MNSNGTLEGHGLLLLLSWKGEKEIQFEATATIGVEVGFLRGWGESPYLWGFIIPGFKLPQVRPAS